MRDYDSWTYDYDSWTFEQHLNYEIDHDFIVTAIELSPNYSEEERKVALDRLDKSWQEYMEWNRKQTLGI